MSTFRKAESVGKELRTLEIQEWLKALGKRWPRGLGVRAKLTS